MRLTLAILLCWSVAAEPLSPDLHNDLLFAVWMSEGGSKTKHPYGIKSVRPRDIHHARQIASRMIAEEWGRWSRAGRRGPFVPHLARRWVPPAADPHGHVFWVRNVSFYLHRANLRAATR
jgi:hypothetical protein